MTTELGRLWWNSRKTNKCGVISPRFDVGVKEIEGWTARLLPSRQFGYIVLTTSAGIMDHEGQEEECWRQGARFLLLNGV
ncbi:hypothetical protein BS78_K074200 [Paspalum vaginatum]|uniref:Small ribosomal subunit protein uS8c n=1 Tax=Paspalum vaginatum TaxID=158149 RepID=A0A9W8CCQ2_9POAL|nr:hypothetical protein BS78_K074200 [Paspalum vaginatum]